MKRHYSHRILSVLIFTSVSVLQAYGAGSIDPGAPDVSGEELKASPEIIEISGQAPAGYIRHNHGRLRPTFRVLEGSDKENRNTISFSHSILSKKIL